MTHIITAKIEITEGQDLSHVQDALAELERATATEPGCLSFRILQSEKTPGQFVLWEVWTDRAALDAHFTYPHTKRVIDAGITRVLSVESYAELSPVAEEA